VYGIYELLFGIVPENPGPTLSCRIGTIEQILVYLELTEEDSPAARGKLSSDLQKSIEEHPGWAPGFNDIIALKATKLASKFSSLNNLPMPNMYHPGLLTTQEGLRVFCERLEDHANAKLQSGTASEQLRSVLSRVRYLTEAWNTYWNGHLPDELRSLGSEQPSNHYLPYQAAMLNEVDEVERYLHTVEVNSSEGGFCYDNLIFEHSWMAISTSNTLKTKNIPPAAKRSTAERAAMVGGKHACLFIGTIYQRLPIECIKRLTATKKWLRMLGLQ
jgi:hypothetical protein